MLCKDVYHCLPDELDRQDFDTVLDHLIVISQLNKAAKTSAKFNAIPGKKNK